MRVLNRLGMIDGTFQGGWLAAVVFHLAHANLVVSTRKLKVIFGPHALDDLNGLVELTDTKRGSFKIVTVGHRFVFVPTGSQSEV